MDRTPVSYHNYVEFLNAVSDRIRVEEGLVKYKEEIWVYLGDGTAPYEQISHQEGRFVLRDAAWASRPMVRVIFLGAQAYARYYHKQLPTLAQWLAGQRDFGANRRDECYRSDPISAGNANNSMMSSGRAPSGGPLEGDSPIKEWVVEAKPLIRLHLTPRRTISPP